MPPFGRFVANDVALVQFDDAFTDGEAKARAGSSWQEAHERFERMKELTLRHALTSILDCNEELRASASQARTSTG